MLQKNLIQKTQFYIDGAWRSPVEEKTIEVMNPADEKPYAVISAGSAADVDLAVAAARRAFPAWSETPAEERIAYIRRIAEI
ncbi:aldehyde dehydrogenase family protein, partial [Brucella abortus]